MADELCVMNLGKVVEMSDMVQIYENPTDDYTKKLLQTIPRGIHDARFE